MRTIKLFRADVMRWVMVCGMGAFFLVLAGCGGGAEKPAAAGGGPSTATAGTAGTGSGVSAGGPVAVLSYVTLKEYPHDMTAYTEGLLVHDQELYESTGHTSDLASTRSLFGVVDLATGKIKTRVELDKDRYFGEGICFLGNKVYQLTYTTGVGFVYDAKTFQRLGDFRFPGKEGWGMTTDGTSLILSDGTPQLWWLDPSSFGVRRVLPVTENGALVNKLNELEFIRGYLYANVYGKDFIVKIDPSTGRVVARIDLSSLAIGARNKYPGSMEMNGIAWDSVGDQVYITGKMWPVVYAIRFSL